MPHDARAEVTLVFPFDFGHGQKTVDQILAPAAKRMSGCSFVFNYIPTFEPARPVHRSTPATDMTQESEHTPNHRRPYFSDSIWPRAQTGQHLPDQLPVVPFLVFNGLDATSFLRIAYRMPVTTIGEARSQFTGIGHLQGFD
jgi:hypothetical protein